MTMRVREAKSVFVMAASLLGLAGGPARAEQRGAVPKDEATLVVDGVVREVFRSPRRDRVDYLVQIEVKRSEAGRTPREPARVLMPAPGDAVYVHASDSQAAAPGQFLAGDREQPAAGGRRVVPAERSQVRAYLVPRARGGWEGTSPDWFEVTSNTPVAEGPTDPPPAANEPAPGARPGPSGPADAPASKSALTALGLSAEGMNAQGRFVIRVTSVERGGPAQRAGLEPGDFIIQANDAALTSLDQLDQMARRGGTLNLIVLDVNTGRGARVAVDLGAAREQPPVASAPANPAPAPAPSPAGSRRSLGISAEPVAVGQRTAMRVARVEAGSPAEKAGIERGDVIVAANGAPVTGVEQLGAAISKSGPTLRLTIRDTRTGRDVPVDVNIGGPPSTDPNPIPDDPRIRPGAGRRLGAVTELFLYDIEAAVKVTEVEPNSPAARAGLEPGDIIIQANGKPVLHPQTLNEIVGQSGPTLKLLVVDPRNNQKTNVDVNLGDGR
jgi:S1-C subfamily serine protease